MIRALALEVKHSLGHHLYLAPKETFAPLVTMERIMIPNELKDLVLVPARHLLEDPLRFPAAPGAYLFFFKGGTRLLEATSYFKCDDRRPVSIRGRQHLYTGAARDLRVRLRQHMEADLTSSSLRMTLLAIEQNHRAISRSQTSACAIKGEKTLTEWMCKNAYIGLMPADDPFKQEREILERYPSPFNIVMRRQHPYARALSNSRQIAFPAGRPENARQVRHI
jgi:hypothetical protein